MHAINGNYCIWNENYSKSYTKVLGYIKCRVISKRLGVQSAEINRGDVIHIKFLKWSHLSQAKIEKKSIIYNTKKVI